ncbi:MAG: DUF885 domain-containing protein [Alphaproteobacteria bacterium]|nr:MAG: DUF885 domain-containing protein [Alphaproteobacteria bacterium]
MITRARRLGSFLLIGLLTLAAGACGPGPSTQNEDKAKTETAPPVDTIIAEATRDFMQTQPLLSSFVDVPEDLVGGPYNDRITDYSPAGFTHVREVAEAAARRLEAIDRAPLTPKQRVNVDVIERIFRYYAGVPGIDYGLIDSYFGHVPYVVSQISGPHVDIPKLMQTQQRLASRADAEAYVRRLQAFGPAFDGIIAKIEADKAAGVVPPKIIVEKALKPVVAFIAPAPAENVLVTSFAKRLESISELAENDRATLVAAATAATGESVYPAYRKLETTLEALLPVAGDAAGVWALPDGDRFYRTVVRFLGDTDLSPDEIHRIGLKEVDRISAEMDRILKAQGLVEGTVGERMVKLAEDPSQYFPDSDEGRAAILDYLRAQVKEVEAKVPDYFATIPPQKLEIRRIPVFSQEGEAGGFYTNPSLDGTRPGIYWINLRDMKAWPKWSLKTLTYHEAVPGHHFQTAISMNQGELPLLRRIAPFNAYTEGWALYSERLAYEMGLYEGDPLGNLGRLQDELFRAVRLVVDTGIHAKHWTREEAIDYMYRTTGSDKSEVVPEIERYMAWPGQALGYKLGMLKILELRERAKRELGPAFDLKAFHDVVLLDGAVPMAVLEVKVNAWIEQMKGAG